jgi:hypothetical protein
MKPNELDLGHLVEGKRGRDAAHVAVLPVTAAESLKPGDHIGFDADKKVRAMNDSIGIVDPFLRIDVKEGERFLMLLYPGTVSLLRHEWTHPGVPDETETETGVARSTAESEKWLRDYAEGCSIDYDALMGGAMSGEGVTFGTEIRGEGLTPEFWWHLETMTGKRFSPDHKESTACNSGCAC